MTKELVSQCRCLGERVQDVIRFGKEVLFVIIRSIICVD